MMSLCEIKSSKLFGLYFSTLLERIETKIFVLDIEFFRCKKSARNIDTYTN